VTPTCASWGAVAGLDADEGGGPGLLMRGTAGPVGDVPSLLLAGWLGGGPAPAAVGPDGVEVVASPELAPRSPGIAREEVEQAASTAAAGKSMAIRARLVWLMASTLACCPGIGPGLLLRSRRSRWNPGY